jgi:Zn-dependent oligopeptidase
VNAKQGFREFQAARRTIQGYEVIHMIRKGQARWVAADDLVRQIQFIDNLFDLAAWERTTDARRQTCLHLKLATLPLNQALYHALAALDVSKADRATQYYVQRTLLEFRLAGVDKDDATRAHIKTLNDEITKYATQFERNLQESQLKVVVKTAAELDGLPEDFIKTHKPAADGTITLTSDSPDVTPW